jgi:sRNA-binding protein
MHEDAHLIIDRLCAAFPACFDRSSPKPLKIGLGGEVLALAEHHPALADLTRTRIRRAIRYYTGAPAYQKALVKGGLRYGLDGQPSGMVTPEQQAVAAATRRRTPASSTGYIPLKLVRRHPDSEDQPVDPR